MLKTFLIGLKDVRLVFRDRTALIFMLAAPFVITLGMGLITGGFSSTGGSGISDISVRISARHDLATRWRNGVRCEPNEPEN